MFNYYAGLLKFLSVFLNAISRGLHCLLQIYVKNERGVSSRTNACIRLDCYKIILTVIFLQDNLIQMKRCVTATPLHHYD